MPIVEVPFSFQVEGAPKGKRKIEKYSFAGKVVVQVAAPSGEEAPVVLRRHNPEGEDRHGRLPPIGPLDLRLHDGRLFEPVIVHYGGDPGRPLAVDEMLGAVRNGIGGGDNPLYDGTAGLFRKSPLAEDDATRRTMKIDRSEEEEATAEIVRKAQDLILVDGVVYRHRPGLEPIYEIQPDADWHEGEVRLIGTVATRAAADFAGKPEEIDVRRHFRVDQLSEALLACAAANQLFTDWDDEDPRTFAKVLPGWVEVLDPTVLAFRPDQGPKLLKTAHELVANHGLGLAEKPVGFMIAYAGLRDALQANATAADAAALMREFALQLGRVEGPDSGRVRNIVGDVETFELAPTVEPASAPTPRAA
jgi:hypothetical protein